MTGFSALILVYDGSKAHLTAQPAMVRANGYRSPTPHQIHRKALERKFILDEISLHNCLVSFRFTKDELDLQLVEIRQPKTMSILS